MYARRQVKQLEELGGIVIAVEVALENVKSFPSSD
jgi:hypothetical protein